MSYFGNIKRGISSTAKGLGLTLKHLVNARISKSTMTIHDDNFFQVPNGHVTLEYPHETISVPDHGRYQLDCEIDDCIVCDKCAKICPVDCIEIEAIKSPELIRHTSDGSPVRLHAAKFDIDMAKCCFCGLCTTVCPTECLTMNSEYDYSTIDVTDLNFAFSNLSEAEAQEKRELYEQFVAEKEALKQEQAVHKSTTTQVQKAGPVFRPTNKPREAGAFVPQKPEATKPAFKPNMKPKAEEVAKPAFTPNMKPKAEGAAKPAFTPNMKPKAEEAAKPAFTPNMKPKAEEDAKPAFTPNMKPKAEEATKPAFTPNMKPKTEGAAKPAFTPNMKPKAEEATKPAFTPSMKPKAEEVAKPAFSPGMKPKTEGAAKPAFTPTQKPNPASPAKDTKELKSEKVVFRPTLKPKK